jgi:hypothetical protein
MRSSRLGSAGAILLVAIALSSPAQANDPAKSRALFQEAAKRYNINDYKEALELFKGAYLEMPDAAYLFNIAQCQRQLGDYAAASKSYRTYLREGRSLSAKSREDIQRLIAEMEQAVREQRAKAPPTGTREPGTEAPTTTNEPPANPPPSNPSPAVPPPATTAPSATSTPPPPRPWYKNAAGMGLTGGGIVVMAVGAGLLGGASAANSSAINATTLPDQRDAHSRAVGFQDGGIALLVVGGTAAVTGAIVLAVGARHHEVQR